MSSKQEKRKKKKKYYQSNKKQRTGVLETGLKGFLITCNNEQQCVKESYNLLNEFADDLFGTEDKDSQERSESADVDIEEELAKEIENIKCKKRRFQQVCTMVKGILFINTTVPDPTNLVTSIFENVLQTGQRRTRYILKMKPVIITCKPSEADIRKHMDEYLQEFIQDDKNKKFSYKIDCNIRHNSNVTTAHILWYVRESVEKHTSEWVVSLTEPQLVISVYVLRSVCCIGLLKNFMEYRKYNLSEAATASEKDLQKGKFQAESEAATSENDLQKSEFQAESAATPSEKDLQKDPSQLESKAVQTSTELLLTSIETNNDSNFCDKVVSLEQ